MKILITGITGFFGKSLLRHIDLLNSSSNEDIEYIYGEASSYNEFMRLVNKERPNVVIFNSNKATMPWLTYRRLFKVNFIKILFSHDLNMLL